jgi:hypothetical protein
MRRIIPVSPKSGLLLPGATVVLHRVATVAFVLVIGSLATNALANTYCPQSAAQLSMALADAGNGGAHNGQNNIIHIGAGTLTTTGVAFFFGTTSGADLTIDGGWNSACTVQSPSPGTTVLDGGSLTQVLSISTNGNLTVMHLTIRHGSYVGGAGSGAGSGAAIALNGANANAIVIVSSNVVRDNTSSVDGGAGLAISGSGTVTVEDNLFTGNSSTTVAALSVNLTLGTAYLTNNTITNNTNSTNGSAITSIGSSSATGFVSNTISYANQGPSIKDFHLDGTGTVQFVHSDYASIDGTPAAGTGNFTNVDPKFVSAADYHLRDFSPLLRAGTATPMGGLPAMDLEGNPRSSAGKVDLGAYQNVYLIFANGFDPP